MVRVAVHRAHLLEGQRIAARAHALQRLGIPEGLQPVVDARELRGQRRIDHDLELVPRQRARRRFVAPRVDDLLDLVQQLLRAPDAERRDQHRAAVGQRALDHALQPAHAIRAPLVAAVAVGALDHQRVAAERRLGFRQQRRVRGAEVAGEDHAVAGGRGFVCGFGFSRTFSTLSDRGSDFSRTLSRRSNSVRLKPNPRAGR